MSRSPHQATRDFEAALCEYTGAKYAVTTNSCTMALLLAIAWHDTPTQFAISRVSIPKRTYVSVPMVIRQTQFGIKFRDEDWVGAYQLHPFPIYDCARRFTSGMYVPGQFQCVSFHTSKILGDSQGGAILHDNAEADAWLRKARFDGRTEGVAPKDDKFDMIGWHCYMSPDVAARLLWKLSVLPKHNADLPNDDYPDLSTMEIFK
jgi:dTDP-4-amino-4,6-dideoxygalactose transaminase